MATVTPESIATSAAPRSGDRYGGSVLRCATIGVGRMGRHHARVYTQIEGCRLVAVVDAEASRREAVADKFACRALENVDELLDLGVDAVTVATPTTSHRPIAEKLLRAGVACLIEKPLAGSVEDALAIKDLAESTGTVLMVGHIERFNPIMRAMRASTSDDAFPLIPRFMQIHRVSPMTFRSIDVGVVMDMMIHDLDVVLMLMDGQEPTEIHAAGVSVITEHEDLCNAWLTFEKPTGRCVANVTASRLALKTERVARITGENAYIKIDYGAKTGTIIRRRANDLQMREVREQIRRGADLTDLNWHDLVNVEPLLIDDVEPLLMEVRSFIGAVRTGDRPEIDAEAGFANVRTAQRIVAAIRGG